MLAMLCTCVFGATISSIKYRKGTVTVEYYVGSDDATIMAYDAADPSNVIYVDQEPADGSFSFGVPEDFTGEQVTVRIGGKNEAVAEETVYVTPTPAPTPDPESIEAGGIYGYVNKEDFTTASINYDEKYMVTEADFKEVPNTAAFAKGADALVVYDEYAGSEGVLYVQGHALGFEDMTYYFDPITSGKAKISVKFMYASMPQAGGDGECPFFSIQDSSGTYAIKNCAAQYTSSTVPVSGMYFYDTASDYVRYRTPGSDSSWHTLTYIIDMDTKTFDVDYDGTLYEGNHFFGDVTNLSQIYFRGCREQWNGNYYVDEIKVMAESADEYPTHTVTFYNDDEETVIATQQIKDGRRMIPAEAPARRGHTFIGWYLADGTEADFSSITDDMSVYALYLPKCTIDFYNEDRETLLGSVTVDYAQGAHITNPTKEGYTFMGWVDGNGTVIDLSSITQNWTAYAWFEKQPVISYYDLDAEGNAILYDTQVIDYATDAPAMPAPTSRTDATFIAWGTMDGSVANLSCVTGNRKVYAIYGTEDSSAVEDFETLIDRVNEVAGDTVMTASGIKDGTYEGIQGSTGFEKESLYAFGDSRAGGVQYGWKTEQVNGSKVWKHVMCMACNSDDMKFYPAKAETTDVFHIGYDFKMDQWNNAQSVGANAGGFGSVFGTKKGSTTSAELVFVTASTRDNRGLAVLDPSTNTWVSILPYDSANPDLTWHHVDYYIDMASQKIAIALDGVIKAYVPLSTTEVTSIDYLRFCLLHGGHIGTQSYFNLDNVAIQAYTNSGVTPAPTYYNVTFLAEDGETVLDTQSVIEGGTAVYGGATPTKEGTATISYVFDGWSSSIANVYDNITVTPVFRETARKYNVTFVIDGKETVVPTEYGAAAVAPQNPTKAPTAQYEYTFREWDKPFDNITSDLTVTALFDEAVRYYTVTFYHDDGTTVLGTSRVAYGESATAPEEPTKENTAQYEYAFSKWDKDFSNVSSDLTVTAVFTATLKSYTVTYYDDDKTTVLHTTSTKYGNSAVRPNNPYKAPANGYVYTFAGWVLENGESADTELSNITGPLNVYAKYDAEETTTRTITFLWGDVNNDGKINAFDASAITNALTGGQKVYGEYTVKEAYVESMLWGDVNNDGKVNAFDTSAITNALTGGQKTYGPYTFKAETSFEVPIN